MVKCSPIEKMCTAKIPRNMFSKPPPNLNTISTQPKTAVVFWQELGVQNCNDVSGLLFSQIILIFFFPLKVSYDFHVAYLHPVCLIRVKKTILFQIDHS